MLGHLKWLAMLAALTFNILPLDRAFAQSPAEKDAFEAARELGTVEAWDAFLSNFPTGFHADLARAYVKKLAAQPQPAAPPQPPSTPGSFDYPMVAGSWGGVVRNGPGQGYGKVDSVPPSEMITLMAPPDRIENGYPWFKIAYGDGREGFMWGGNLCSNGAERPDLHKVCTFTPTISSGQSTNQGGSSASSSRSQTKKTSSGCGSGRIRIDGKCIKKQDAASYCGPGYRLKGSKCVPGYRAPKATDPIPSWQKEAIQKGCPKGMAWNAAEGCHEDD